MTHRCRSVKKLSSILTIHRVLPDPVLWFRSMRLTGGRQGKRSRPQAQKSPQSTSGGVCELHILGVGVAAKTCQNQPRCPQHAIHKLCSPPACRSQPVSSQRGGRRMNLVQVPCLASKLCFGAALKACPFRGEGRERARANCALA